MTAIELRPVPLTDLAGAMLGLWEEIEAADPAPLTRTLTANLIVVVRAGGEAELAQIVERVLMRHPCRGFLVVLDETLDDVQAQLGARVRPGRGCRQTELELVGLRTPQRAFAKVPGTIRPLLIQDLPVHLFWAAPLPANDWDVLQLGRMADQTIVHSCRFEDPVGDLQRLDELGELVIVDLAHFRLRPWRRALAEAFEHFEWSPRVPTPVRIERGPACGAAAAAYLLSRWLVERLRADVEVDETGAAEAPADEPFRLELTHDTAHVVIERLIDSAELRTTITLRDRCLLPIVRPASRGRDGDLLAAAVDRL